MHKMRNLILLVISLLFVAAILPACKKPNRNRSLHVQLVEAGTQKPLQNFKVDMYYFKAGSSLFNGSTLLYATAYTGADGKVFVDGSEYDPVELRIYAPEPKKYYDYENGTAVSVPGLKGDNAVIEMNPYAWLGLKVDLSIYNGEFDYVACNYGLNLTGVSDLITSSNIGDTLIPRRVMGNSTNTIYYYGIKNGQQIKTWQNTMYCPGFDTTYFIPTYSTMN